MTDRPNLLVYESDGVIASLLDEQIEDWQVTPVPLSENLSDYLPAHAILLAGEGDHISIAAAMRQAHMIGPIFSLNNAGSGASPLILLERPLRLNSLIGKLRAPDAAAIDGAIVGEWRLDAVQRSLVGKDSASVENLTDKEFEVLALLLLAAPAAVSRETLQNEIWQYNPEATTHTVETHIWRLRQKLETDPGQPRWLITTAEGYCLARD